MVRESCAPSFWKSFSSSGAPRHSCDKQAWCLVFCATVCDIFLVNLGKLTSVWKERHLARFLVLSGEVFVFQSSFPHDDALQNGWWKTNACPPLRWRNKRWFFFTRSGLRRTKDLSQWPADISNAQQPHFLQKASGDSQWLVPGSNNRNILVVDRGLSKLPGQDGHHQR